MVNMEGNYERMLNQEWRIHDLKLLTTQISEHESLLRLKRRWLMDVPLSASEQKRLEEIIPPNDKMLPESLLRDEDVSHEDIKTCIEKGFRVRNNGSEGHCSQKDLQVLNLYDTFRDVFYLLDDLNNKGLCSFIEILIGSDVKFEKTNYCMKRTIRGLLQKIIIHKREIPEMKLKQLFHLLKDSKSFRRQQMVFSTDSKSYHAAAVKVLDGLDDFPFRALLAMHRKLRGIKGYIPMIQPPRNGMSRDKLTKLVKKYSMEMLSHLGEVVEPPEQLVGALGVAGLTLKLIMNCPDVREFRKFSPEIEALQNEIARAIQLLNDTKKVSMIQMKKVQQLLDPGFRLSVRSIRTAIRNLLIEYLFECADMDEIPDCIRQSLNIINRSQRPSSKIASTSKVCSSSQGLMTEEIENEVESVLIISAQAKGVVLDLPTRHEFDEDYANAYVENFKESDTMCISEDDDEQVGCVPQFDEFLSNGTFGQAESIGETYPAEMKSSISTSETNDYSSFSPPGTMDCLPNNDIDFCNNSEASDGQCSPGKKHTLGRAGQVGLPNATSHDMTTKKILFSRSRTPESNSGQNEVDCEETSTKDVCSDFLVEEANIISQQNYSRNQYLVVQEACDVTSMITYYFVGHMLNKLAEDEGLELYQGDRIYLRSNASVPEDSDGLPDKFFSSGFSEFWRSVHQ